MCKCDIYVDHWYGSLVCANVTYVHAYVLNEYMLNDSFTLATCDIYLCDMTHPNVWRDSFIRVTGLVHVCECGF